MHDIPVGNNKPQLADLLEQSKKALAMANMELSEALEKLHSIQQQMIRQERLNALTQMASGIAHDFNNILMPISGFAEYLLSNPAEWKNEESMREMLGTILDAAHEARDVVKRMREFYRPVDDEPFEGIAVDQLIREAVDLCRPRWTQVSPVSGETVRMKLKFNSSAIIECQRTRLRDVFINLIMNAVDAMPEGGTLTISVADKDNGCRIVFADEGKGMSAEVLSRCSDPFFSTKEVRGAGMGLAICYGVLKQYNGSIRIDSTPGRGSTVALYIPSERSNQQEQLDLLPGKARSLHVLVVDDDPRILAIVSSYLKNDGHKAVCVQNAQKALALLNDSRFDVVLTDRAMPDMSGDKLAQEISLRNENINVVMLTGFGDMLEENGRKPAGVDQVLGKPISPHELRRALSRYTDTYEKE